MDNLYDCHTHLNLPQYDGRRAEIIAQCILALDFMVNVGFDEASCEASLSLAYQYGSIYAALGFHPTSSSDYDGRSALRLKKMVAEEKVVALGEIGLDYYWMKDPKASQKKVFFDQMSLAQESGLPVIIHDRDAHHDVLDIMRAFKGRVTGVLHSFSADKVFASEAADMGYYFSISGPVTFKSKKNDALRETVSFLPDDRILIETDSPYLSPHPLRGTINSPMNVRLVAEKAAELKNMAYDEFLAVSRANAKRIFGI